MVMHVPPSQMRVLRKDGNGLLRAEDGTTYSLNEEYLEQCLDHGIDQMICTPSGGGDKHKVARLEWASLLSESTPPPPHVRCIYVKPGELQLYRELYPDLILVALPERSEALTAAAKVGDARFWIKASVVQLRLDAQRRGAKATYAFLKRFWMFDDDITGCYKGDARPARRGTAGREREAQEAQEEGAGSRRILLPPADGRVEAEVGQRRQGCTRLGRGERADGHRRAVPPARRAR